MTEAYIYDAVRTPRGKGKKDGRLHQATPVWLLRTLLQALQARNRLDTALVDDLVLGCVTPVTEVLRTTENTLNICLGKLDEPLVCINMKSVFDNTKDICYENFIGKEDTFFAKYLQAK